MVEGIDKDRLNKVLQLLEEANIRFPVAETVKRTGYKKGHVSNILSGKIPMSGNFYDTFIEKFQPEKKINRIIKTADVGKELSKLIEITIKQQAEINILLRAFSNISRKEINEEANRLYDEYLGQQ